MRNEQQLASSIDLSSLATRARDAYEQKRTKECLTLTKSLLTADPENAEAKALQAAIRSDIQRNLADARALLEDSRRRDNSQEHRKAAEILLLKILYLDPEHGEAKVLLSSAKGVPAPVAAPAAIAPAPVAPKPKPDVIQPPEETVFAVEYRRIEKNEQKGRAIKLPGILLGLVVVAGLLMITGRTQFRQPPEPPTVAFEPRQEISVQQEVVPIATEDPYVDTVPAVGIPAASPSVAVEKPSATVVATAPAPVAPIEPGTLAVSSLTAAEIYMGDKYLGSTPITLELPAGSHTLEYRHNDLRQVITHMVKGKETTTAMVTFDVTVQINARPWAQVFIDGTQRRPLGQTPLSDVKIPIGSVLVFENPNFPAKTYRVTGKETAIQVVFP